MSTTLESFNVFIASPRGLEKERELFSDAIIDYNRYDANPRGLNYVPVGWEVTLGGIGRPQSIINEEIQTCDFFVLLLHDRWGSVPDTNQGGKFTSGTEEEFHVAIDCYNDRNQPMKQIILFFKAVNERQLNDPGDELKKVLTFRKTRELNKDFLYETFDTPESFKEKFRRHLSSWSRKMLDHSEPKHKEQSKVVIESIENATLPINVDINTLDGVNKLLEIADTYAIEGKILEAELFYSQLSVRTEAPLPLIKYARFLRKIGQTQRSIDLLKKAIDRAVLYSDNNNLAYAYRQLGRAEENFGNNDSAKKQYEKALEIYETCNMIEGSARTYRDLGLIYRKKSDYVIAIEMLTKSLDLYRSINDDNGIATALGCIGLIYKAEGLYTEAEDCYKQALDIQKRLDNREAEAIVLSNLAVIYRSTDRLDQAEQYHLKALSVFKEINNKKGITREFSNLGVVYRTQNKLQESKEMHNKALEIAEQLGSLDGMAIQYGNLGYIAQMEGDLKTAEEMHRKSLEIAINIGDKIGQSIQYNYLGMIYRSKSEFDRALNIFKKALSLDSECKNVFRIALTNLQIAKTYLLMNDYNESLMCAEISYDVFDKNNNFNLKLEAEDVINNCKIKINSI